MSLNLREIVGNDANLLQLLNIVNGRTQNENDAIIISDDIGSICAKITMINTKNPKTYTRRLAWTLTGTLLLGLTTYYNLQLQICFDESHRLKEMCRHLYIVQTTKTTKRKVKRITDTKNRKRRTIEYEEETESVKRYRFWEEPLKIDEHLPEDTCLVPDVNQITLREFNEPSDDHRNDEFDNEFGFGADMDFQLMDDDEMPLFDSVANDDIEKPPQCTPTGLDENMNTLAPKIGQNLLSDLSPIMPLSIPVQKKRKDRRVSSLLIDTNTALPSDLMRRRISDVFVNCKKRFKIAIRDKQKFALSKLKSIDLFSIPVMKGSFNRELFALTAEIKPAETDWTIIQDAFDSSKCDNADEANGSTVSSEVDILRNESENGIRTRGQHRNQMSLNPVNCEENLQISAPIRPLSPSNIQCSTPYHSEKHLNLIPSSANDDLSSIRNEFISPPSNFRNSIVTPPNDFLNDNNNQIDFNQNVPDDHNDDFEPMASPQNADLISLLGANTLEYTTISKLMKLWQKTTHPIKVENLLTPRCNRFQAAKTFNSLLTLKKKKLVQLENTEDGKIAHISQGEELPLN